MIQTNTTFNDIEDNELRAWNRASMGFNIGADEGTESMTEYFAQFSTEDKLDINNIFKRIMVEGYNVVRSDISKHLQAQTKVSSFEENEANATVH